LIKRSEKQMKELKYPRPDDELDWLAFCFVAGEMDDRQRAEFEHRLADDQGAREAVARAVELCQAAAVVDAQEHQRPMPQITVGTASWPRSLAWLSIGASAALVLAAAGMQLDTIKTWFTPPPVNRTDLAEVWSQTRESVRDIVQGEPIEAPPLTESDFSSEVSLPSWITAAVFSQAPDADPDGESPSTHDET
jgi:hypothetical protein